ncbi:MAG: hypothetical protein QGF90_05950 [Gammaproteobacteria bacterium]|nr:hypothetical protein [Gammaproteobacteria bacterium]
MSKFSFIVILCSITFSVQLIAQSETVTDWQMPRTEHGHPDLQGIWLFGSRTPLQRPARLGTKQTYTEQEVIDLERTMREAMARQDADLDPGRGAPEQGARIGQEADDTFLAHFRRPELIRVNGEFRTSVILDPPDGRIHLRDGFQDFGARRRAAGSVIPTVLKGSHSRDAA